jgi:hypothetical protein
MLGLLWIVLSTTIIAIGKGKRGTVPDTDGRRI